MDAIFTNGNSTIGVCTTPTLRNIPLAGICTSWCLYVAHTRDAVSSCSLHCFEWGESHAAQSAVLHPFNHCGGTYSSGGSAESPNPPAFPTWWGGIFQVSFHPVTKLTLHVWWLQCGNLVSCSWTYLHLFGRVFCCLITYLPRVYRQGVNTNWLPTWSKVWQLLFLDQAVANIEHGLGSILTNSIETI